MALAAQEELWDRASSDTPILSWTLDWLRLETGM